LIDLKDFMQRRALHSGNRLIFGPLRMQPDKKEKAAGIPPSDLDPEMAPHTGPSSQLFAGAN